VEKNVLFLAVFFVLTNCINYTVCTRLLKNHFLFAVIECASARLVHNHDKDTWAQFSWLLMLVFIILNYFPFISRAAVSKMHFQGDLFDSPRWPLTELCAKCIDCCSISEFLVLLQFLWLTMFTMEMQVQNLHHLLYIFAFCDIYNTQLAGRLITTNLINWLILNLFTNRSGL